MHRKSLDVGRRPRVPLLLVPAATVDPLAGLGGLDPFGDHRHDPVPGLRVHQLQAQLRRPDAGEVPVTLDETRDHELPLDVDHLGLRTDEFLDLRAAANGDDPAASNRDRLGVRCSLLDGHDLAVRQDEIGGVDGRLLTATC